MNKKMTFKQKVQSMTAAEIILAMVDGLSDPPIEVNMMYFGYVGDRKGKEICFGCAATVTIMRISGKEYDKTNISKPETRADFMECSIEFLQDFEYALNFLRMGYISRYNEIAKRRRFARIENTIHEYFQDTGSLTSMYTQSDLDLYRLLAVSQ